MATAIVMNWKLKESGLICLCHEKFHRFLCLLFTTCFKNLKYIHLHSPIKCKLPNFSMFILYLNSTSQKFGSVLLLGLPVRGSTLYHKCIVKSVCWLLMLYTNSIKILADMFHYWSINNIDMLMFLQELSIQYIVQHCKHKVSWFDTQLSMAFYFFIKIHKFWSWLIPTYVTFLKFSFVKPIYCHSKGDHKTDIILHNVNGNKHSIDKRTSSTGEYTACQHCSANTGGDGW